MRRPPGAVGLRRILAVVDVVKSRDGVRHAVGGIRLSSVVVVAPPRAQARLRGSEGQRKTNSWYALPNPAGASLSGRLPGRSDRLEVADSLLESGLFKAVRS